MSAAASRQVNRYLKVCGWAEKRYAGEKVPWDSNKFRWDGSADRIEMAAWNRYMK